jgi:hypothetical protein
MVAMPAFLVRVESSNASIVFQRGPDGHKQETVFGALLPRRASGSESGADTAAALRPVIGQWEKDRPMTAPSIRVGIAIGIGAESLGFRIYRGRCQWSAGGAVVVVVIGF